MSSQAHIKKRHQCSCCQRRINEEKMYSLYYPLIHRISWTCTVCYKKHIFEVVRLKSSPKHEF